MFQPKNAVAVRNKHVTTYMTNKGPSVNSRVIAARHSETANFLGGMQGGRNPMSITAMGNNLSSDGVLDGLIPKQEQMLHKLYKDIYDFDAVGGATVDLMSTFPFSDVVLYGVPDKELEIHKETIARLNLVKASPEMTRQLLVDGYYTSTLVYNPSKKIFIDQIPYDATDIEDMQMMALYSMDPLITVKVSDRIRNFVTSDNPTVQRLRNQLPAQLLSALNSDAFELDPLTTLFLARRMLPTTPPVSIYRRLIPYYLLEKTLFKGTLFEAGRRQRALLHLAIGDDAWEPTAEELILFVNAVQQGDLDPMGGVVATRNGVSIEEFRAGGDFWKVTDVWQDTASFKMKAMGVSDAFLSGDACMPGDTLVPTTQGLLTLEELIPDAKSLGRNEPRDIHDIEAKSRYGVSGGIKLGLYNGEREVFRIKTQDRKEVKATSNHPFLVFNGTRTEWKQVDELQVGDVLCQDTQTLVRQDPLELNLPKPDLRYKESHVAITAPTKMTPKLAYLLGALVAEGWVSEQQVGFANTSVDYTERVVRFLKSEFNYTVTSKYLTTEKGNSYSINGVIGTVNHDCSALVISSKFLVHYLRELGLPTGNDLREATGVQSPSRSRYIPWSIRQADESSQLAFLAGYLDGDGSIQTSNRITFCSSSMRLHQEMASLLAAHGTYSTTSRRGEEYNLTVSSHFAHDLLNKMGKFLLKSRGLEHKALHKGAYKTYCLPLAGYQEVLQKAYQGFNRHGMIFRNTRGKVRQFSSRDLQFDFGGAWVSAVLRGSIKGMFYNEGLGGLYEVLNFIDPEVAKAYKEMMESRYVFTPITSIESAGVERVYDISMHGEPAFVANGFVVHNTYSNGDTGLVVFMEYMNSLRSGFTHAVYEKKVFPLTCSIHGLYKEGKGGKGSGLDMNNHDAFNIPKLRYVKALTTHKQDNVFEVLDKLADKGVPVPLRMLAIAADIDPETLISEIEEDRKFRKELAKAAGADEDSLDMDVGGGGEGGGDYEGASVRDSLTPRIKGVMGRDYGEQGAPVDHTRTGKKKAVLSGEHRRVRQENEQIMKSVARLDDKHYYQGVRNRLAVQGKLKKVIL